MTTPDTDRKAKLVVAALHVATAEGYNRISYDDVARRAKCSKSLVMHYFSTMTKLRRAIMSAAVSREHLPVIAQGLAARDSKALTAPEHVRRRALDSLML